MSGERDILTALAPHFICTVADPSGVQHDVPFHATISIKNDVGLTDVGDVELYVQAALSGSKFRGSSVAIALTVVGKYGVITKTIHV